MDSEIFSDSIAKKKLVPARWSLFSTAKRYLKNVFKYDISLNKYPNSYPYEYKHLDKWFTKEVSRGKGKPPAKILFYNATSISKARHAIGTKVRESGSDCLEYWFHGTDSRSAEDIVTKGINLKKGNEKLDFSNSNGFYLNPDGMSAVEWAQQKNNASVIVFEESQKVRDDHKLLDLRGDGESWKKVVKWNRSGEERREQLDGQLSEDFNQCDYIRGPMAGDNTEYTESWEPQPIHRSDQICVKTKQMAEVMLDHIHGVVSWNK